MTWSSSPLSSRVWLCLVVGFFETCLFAESVPGGFGQLENPPVLIDGGVDAEGRSFSYLGQRATKQKIILTASNGFFTNKTCTAKGKSRLPKVGDGALIVPNFEYLDWRRAGGSLRWHLLVTKPGKVRFHVHLAAAGGGARVGVRFAGQTKTVTTSTSDGDEPQAWDLVFDVEQPGEYPLSLEAESLGRGNTVGRLQRIDAFGPAMEDAHLLRVRWRPAAAHGRYDTAKVDGATLLVFTTRSVAPVSSYSPITTPFGYFGSSFGSDGRSAGNFNFSMWGKKGAAADLKTMPHLLGVGSPDGEFSGFGHEGSGVKPRGWEPMPDRPELVVQALRLVSGDDYDTYYGYYFDHPSKAWKLYGAGRKWHGGKPVKHLKLGSFCEVPGPPQSQRSGDIYREVRRRGWAWNDGKWVALETYVAGGAGSSGDRPVNKKWYTSEDGAYAMGCGGIRLYSHDASFIGPGGDGDLPDFLTSPSIKNVFTLPIRYGEIQATEVAADRALIEIDLASSAELLGGAVYFGTVDALTFAPRDLHGTERRSELSRAVVGQAWQNVAEIPDLRVGVNKVRISGLKPATTYYYRVLVNNAVSRIWNDVTLTFTTPVSGPGRAN